MPECPRCHQPIDAQAIACPTCNNPLKAFGHPGIPLHQATGDTYLCDTCTYHADDTCNFPKRPYAKQCTLYHNPADQDTPVIQPLAPGEAIARWVRRNTTLLLFLGLIAISVAIVVAGG
ncbi:MAG: zinc ribbon domain-containing protein [Elainellaceae cyanobacterium]